MLAFATNFKQETPYLAEWLEYHLMVGVGHFYLYDQDGSEEVRAVLAPYERAGLVTRHPWTHLDGTRFDGPTTWYQRNKNHLGFAHAARHYRENVTWLMKIDVDEFLVPFHPRWLETHDPRRTKGLRIPRYDFGYDGHEARPEGLVTESYRRREALPSNYKDLASAYFLSDNRWCGSAHRWHYRFFPPAPLRRPQACLFHYYTKSWEEYQSRQNVSRGRSRTREAFERRNAPAHAVEDLRLAELAPRIRAALERRSSPAASSFRDTPQTPALQSP